MQRIEKDTIIYIYGETPRKNFQSVHPRAITEEMRKTLPKRAGGGEAGERASQELLFLNIIPFIIFWQRKHLCYLSPQRHNNKEFAVGADSPVQRLKPCYRTGSAVAARWAIAEGGAEAPACAQPGHRGPRRLQPQPWRHSLGSYEA